MVPLFVEDGTSVLKLTPVLSYKTPFFTVLGVAKFPSFFKVMTAFT